MAALDAANTFDEWLSKWNLDTLQVSLRSHGITSPDDLKFVDTEKQFEELLSSLDNINFMQKCKLRRAWLSIVPNPSPPVVRIHFLGDEEKKILNVINARVSALSKDTQHVQTSFNSFNQSVVSTKKQIHGIAEELTSMINKRKAVLLAQIDSIRKEKEILFNDKLNALDQMTQVIKKHKQHFMKIGSKNSITSEQRLEKLQKLLAINVDNNDDEKHDPFIFLQDSCIVPDKLSFVFNRNSIVDHLTTNFDVKCNDLTTEWHLKLDPDPIGFENGGFTFDIWEDAQFDITENGTVATAQGYCAYALISSTTSLNRGVWKWKIHIVEAKHDWSPSIGIITDVANAMQAGTGSTSNGFKCFRYAYLWDNEQHTLESTVNGTHAISRGQSLEIVEGDVIGMILDCNEWTIEFTQNDETIGTLKVEPNDSYHPMIYSCGCATQQYKLLSVEHSTT